MDQIAYEQGFDACMRGEAPWDNPYHSGTVCHESWDCGWMCANESKGQRRAA